ILKREINRLENEYLLDKFQRNPKIETESRLPEMLITTGGADPYNCTGKLLEILLGDRRTANIKYNVIVGSGFVHKDKIQILADGNSNIVLYINPGCMSEIMCRSDIAISSGGSTLYELCCCGTPTIAFIMADNQKGNVDMLASDEYIQSLGWYNDIENTNLTQMVYDLINDFETRKKYSGRMQSLIDGRGALRIAQEIVTVAKSKK
ncbi:MAG: glycosyltransferase, partial [Ruminiclostridium sp.]